MGSMFRSEEMNLCQIFLQSEAAYACVSELGELGLVQFKDLNPDVNSFQRKFVNEILRCEEMERKLRYIDKELKKDGLKVPDRGDNPKAPAPKEMIDLEATFEKMESELREVNTNAEALRRNFLELTELKEVLKKTQSFFAEHHGAHHGIVEDATHALTHDEGFVPVTAVQLGFVAGVIPREKVPAFERLLWFACRGNVFLKYDDIHQSLEDPVTGDEIHKCVFIIFFQGEQLKARVRKICEGFKATLYPCPESPPERQDMLNGVSMRLEDLNTVLSQTEDHRRRVLASAQKEIRTWIIKVKKIKAIYHTLNLCNFDVSHNSLIAECWCPVSALDNVQMALRHGTDMSGSTVPSILHRMQTKEVPPTFFQTNKFTNVFQTIIDAYGVATYEEVNPAPYTIITFPFLFAVMFGDFGHGFIMFLFGLWMVLSEKKLLAMKNANEIVSIFIGGRYIIMLMGVFSVYTGFVYNDVFSKSVNLFGSSWHPMYSNETLKGSKNLQLNPYDTYNNETGPYPFGLDPVWQAATNKITFLNTFKMKMSVILGVFHMLLGVILSFVNHLHFRNPLNIFCEFIPEMVFLLCLFGYLVALIFVKWFMFDWRCTQIAPLLLIQFINMFLMSYKDVKVINKNFTDYKYVCSDVYRVGKDDDILNTDIEANAQTVFFANQQSVQTILVVLALLMVPVMLLIKPFILRARHNAKMRRKPGKQGALELVNRRVDKRKHGLAATSQGALIHNEEQPDQSDKKADGKMGEAHLSDIELAAVRTKDINFSVNTDEEAAGAGSTHAEETLDEEEEEEEKIELKMDENLLAEDHSEDIAEDEEEEFDFGEIFIHQAIHTIEYCLGCISHTASYLRLWALSLAHAQLSEVLWSMLFNFSLTFDMKYVGAIFIFVIFGAFAVLTVAILLLMEGLSAFLHTLRLHWVEFQSKFYGGEGYHFTPYSFKHLLDASLDD